MGQLPADEWNIRLSLKDDFQRKWREEETKWKQRSRCRWLDEGDKNTRFFREMISSRRRANRISSLVAGDIRLESKDELVQHIQNYFISLHSKDQWNKPS